MTCSVKVSIFSQPATFSWSLPTIDDTPGNVTPVYGLADPLVIKQALTAGDRLPVSHPLPEEATLNIIAPDSTTYQSIALGDPVAITVYPLATYAGTNPVNFYGRVAALTASPHDLGVLYTIGCLDYTTDLSNYTTGQTAYVVHPASTRVGKFTDDAAYPAIDRFGGGPITPVPVGPQVAARSKSPTDLLSAVLEVLDSWTVAPLPVDETGSVMPAGVFNAYRAYLRPQITGQLLDPVTPFRVAIGNPYTRRVVYSPPLRLANVAGLYTLTCSVASSSPSTGAPILDAGSVQRDVPFTMDRSVGMANRITTTDAQGDASVWDWRKVANVGGGFYLYAQATDLTDQPVTLASIDSIVDVSENPSDPTGQLNIVYRVPYRPDVRAAYSPGTLSYQAWHDTDWRRPDLTEILTVARAQTFRNPPNREWVNGIVTATTLTLAGGRPVIDIETCPNVSDYVTNRVWKGASLGVLSHDSPALTTPNPTFTQLSTRDTFADYQIARGS